MGAFAAWIFWNSLKVAESISDRAGFAIFQKINCMRRRILFYATVLLSAGEANRCPLILSMGLTPRLTS
jgi:hypothetical protein